MIDLIKDLAKAGKIISQYQNYHYKLKYKLNVPLNLNAKLPETIQTINVEKAEWDRLQAVANIIRNFKINAT